MGGQVGAPGVSQGTLLAMRAQGLEGVAEARPVAAIVDEQTRAAGCGRRAPRSAAPAADRSGDHSKTAPGGAGASMSGRGSAATKTSPPARSSPTRLRASRPHGAPPGGPAGNRGTRWRRGSPGRRREVPQRPRSRGRSLRPRQRLGPGARGQRRACRLQKHDPRRRAGNPGTARAAPQDIAHQGSIARARPPPDAPWLGLPRPAQRPRPPTGRSVPRTSARRAER